MKDPKLKSMPSTPMTQEEMKKQCNLVSEVSEICDDITEENEKDYYLDTSIELIHYKGKVWIWKGGIDHNGYYHLINPFNESEGILADPLFSHKIEGSEKIDQLSAIQYFKERQ